MSDLSVSQTIRLEAARIIDKIADVRSVLVLAHAIEHGEVKRITDFKAVASSESEDSPQEL